MRIKDIKGITLIALVVTIIVLLILAGVTINIILGEGGIFERASQVEETQRKAETLETLQIILADYQIEKRVYGTSLETYLLAKQQEGELDNVTPNDDGTITVALNGYIQTVTEADLSITVGDKVQQVEGVKPEFTTIFYQTSGEVVNPENTYEELIVTVKVTNKATLGLVNNIVMTDSNGIQIAQEETVIGDGDASFKVSEIETYNINVLATTNNVEESETTSIEFEDGGLLGRITGIADEQTKIEVRSFVEIMLSDYQVDKYVNGLTLEQYLITKQQNGELDKVTPNANGTITVEYRNVKVTINESDLAIISTE